MIAFTVVAAAGWLAACGVARYWWRQAMYDQLTGLPGRARLETAAKHARRRRGSVSVLLLDIDRFKQVNDTFGHRVGDELLAAFAARLGRAAQRGEVAVRLHGDEFAVWLGAAEDTTAARRANQIAAALARPVRIAGRELVMTASVGHATGPARGPLADLLTWADQSMYEVKRRTMTVADLPGAVPAARLRDDRKDVA